MESTEQQTTEQQATVEKSSTEQEKQQHGRLTFSELFKHGSLVALRIRAWTSIIKMKSEDLGIVETEAMSKSISVGSERLVPKDLMQPIQSMRTTANSIVEKYSTNFPLVPGARFVHKNNKEKLNKELQDAKVVFDGHLKKLFDNYEMAEQEQTLVIRQALSEMINGTVNREEVLNNAMVRIRSKYPSLNVLSGKFGFDWNYFDISMPQDASVADLLNKTEHESNLVAETISGTVDEIFEKINKKLEVLKDLAVNGGKITERSVNAIEKLIAQIDGLGFAGDSKKIKESLDKLLKIADDGKTLYKYGKKEAAYKHIIEESDKLESQMKLDAATAYQEVLKGLIEEHNPYNIV